MALDLHLRSFEERGIFMVRGWSIALGVGLVILGLAGLSGPFGSWMAWLDFVAALGSFVIAASIMPTDLETARASSPLILSLGLFVMWIVGLVTASAVGWLSWWNFAFACAYLILGLVANQRRRLHRP